MALTIPELGLLPVKHVTAQCRFRTVVIRTAVALFSHRCRIALLAFALLTFALLSLRTVGIRTVGFALVSFALLSFALLSYKHPFLEELRSRRDAKWMAAIAVSTERCNERGEALGSFVQWYLVKPTVGVKL